MPIGYELFAMQLESKLHLAQTSLGQASVIESSYFLSFVHLLETLRCSYGKGKVSEKSARVSLAR